jgi:hypothetical protein
MVWGNDVSRVNKSILISIFVWLVTGVLLISMADKEIDEREFITRKADVIFAKCDDSRSFIGVNAKLKYVGTDIAVDQLIDISENLNCNYELLSALRTNGILITHYKNWQIEVSSGNILLMSREKGINLVSNFQSVRFFLIFTALIFTLLSVLYARRK